MPKPFFKIISGLINITLLSFITHSCFKKNEAPTSELKVALGSEIPSLDPAMAGNVTATEGLNQSYETLYQYNYLIRPYQLEPLLASELPKVSSDGKIYTFKIKPGTIYHPHESYGDKRTVKAQDFVTQIKRIAFDGTNSNGYWLFKNHIKGIDQWKNKVKKDWKLFFELDIEGIKTPDDLTLEITINEAYPQFIYAFSLVYSAPIPAEFIKFSNNNMEEFIAGTGPFMLKKYEVNHHLHLVKFPKYWKATYPYQGDRVSYEKNLLVDAGKPIPFLDGIHFYIMKEAQTQWLNFLEKKIDYIILSKDHFEIALDESGRLKKEFYSKNIEMQIAPTMTYWWLSFNMEDPIVGKNKNLRKAIAHGIDMNKYIEIFTHNIGLKANSIYCPGIPGYQPSLELPYDYDLKKAKSFLTQAGYGENQKKLTLQYDTRGNSKISQRMAEYIKSELAKLGIEVVINTNTFPVFLKKAQDGLLQMWQGGWAMDYPDPENVLQLLLSHNKVPGPNTANYQNKLFDDLFKQMNPLALGEEKSKLLSQMNDLINDDLPWIMQFYTRNYILYHKHLKNFRQSDIIYNHFKYIKILPEN